MKYNSYIKKLKKCPFCGDIKNRILFENKEAFLTYAIAPYHKYHLLLIPKRHVESIKNLTQDENVCAMSLLSKGLKVLDKIDHNDCTILVRDGKALAKSINHLHFNIIPGGIIKDISLNADIRKLLSHKEEKSLMKELKKIKNI